MKKLIYTAIASTLMTVMLSSCGWHLRGSGQLDSNISSVHISGANKKSDFYRTLSRSLKANKVVITDSHTEAEYRIVTLNQKSERRTATVSSGARVSEYQLTELVDVVIFAASGTQLLPRTTLRVERFYDFDENDVQSKSEEAALLKKEMINDLAQQVVRRLNAVSRRSSSSTSQENNTDNATEG